MLVANFKVAVEEYHEARRVNREIGASGNKLADAFKACVEAKVPEESFATLMGKGDGLSGKADTRVVTVALCAIEPKDKAHKEYLLNVFSLLLTKGNFPTSELLSEIAEEVFFAKIPEFIQRALSFVPDNSKKSELACKPMVGLGEPVIHYATEGGDGPLRLEYYLGAFPEGARKEQEDKLTHIFAQRMFD